MSEYPNYPDQLSPHITLQRAYTDGVGEPSLIDLRDAYTFMASRLRGSYNVPLEFLVPRMFLLPDRATPLGLVVGGPPEAQVVHGAAAAGGAKEDIQVAAFLKSRGWRVAFCLEASPELWRVAEETGMLEQGGDPLALTRRWPFQPSKLLMDQIGIIEELLVRNYCTAASRGTAQSATPSPPPLPPSQPSSSSHADAATAVAAVKGDLPSYDGPSITFRMLDVGCGSGRDLAWLSTRRATVEVPKPAPEPESSNFVRRTRDSAGGALHNGQMRVRWECVGLDSWHGALQRAAEVLTLGDVPAGPGGVTLHLVQIGPGNGALTPLTLPLPTAAAAGAKDSQRRMLVRYLAPGPAALHKFPQRQQQEQQQEQQMQRGGGGRGAAEADAGGCDAAAARDGCQVAAEAADDGGSPPAMDPSELGRFDLLVCVRFLERSFLPAMAKLLKPGGLILFSTFVDGPGLRAFGRPTGREHVLQPDELAATLFGPRHGFRVLRDEVQAIPDGREVSMFCAQKLCDGS